VDILVATPGRLLDHVQQKTVDLRQVEILVLDEADRMLDMGFIHDIRRILALLPAKRQNLLFSATFPEEIRKLASSFMHSPVTVEVARRNTPAELVAQVQHPVNHDRKRELLAHLIKTNDWRQVLVFTKTKHGAQKLAKKLHADGIECREIHGNLAQNKRDRVMKSFRGGKFDVLVATDLASRGIDVADISHIINYDIPEDPEAYIHRVGRTARAGRRGRAITFVGEWDFDKLKPLQRLVGERLERQLLPLYAR
jgi:ATP-dependent RNA helicase RhlE